MSISYSETPRKTMNPFTNGTDSKVKILKFNEVYQNQFPRVWIVLFEIDGVQYNVEIDYQGSRGGELNRVNYQNGFD